MPRRPLSWAGAARHPDQHRRPRTLLLERSGRAHAGPAWPCRARGRRRRHGDGLRQHDVAVPRKLGDRRQPAHARRRVEPHPEPRHHARGGFHRRPHLRRRRPSAGTDVLRPRARRRTAHCRHRLACEASRDFSLPFFKNQQIFETHTAPAVWKELRALGYPVERQGEWAELPRRFLKDAMVADLAVDVLRRHAPDVLLVHFLCADSHQHLYGPRSPEAYWAIAYIDGLVGRVLLALGPDGLDRTAVVVVSDHGFLPVTREIRPNVRLRRRGLLRVADDGGVARAEARFVMNLGAGWVYALGGGDRERLARDLRGELAALEGVAAVWTPQEYASLGLPGLAENDRVGDLLLEAAPGYMLVDETRGEDELGPPHYRGTHGQRPTYADIRAVFVAAGRGVKRGLTLGPISSRDVAPTLTTLLELPAAPAEGRVLSEILA